MAINYFTGHRGFIGRLFNSTDPNGATAKGVAQAVVLVSDDSDTPTPIGGASAPFATQAAPLPAGTDRSATTNATAGQSGQLAAANATRRGLNIQNVSANPMGINEFGGTAAIGSSGTYTLPVGGTINVRTNRQINVVSGTASQPYTATEF